MRGARVKDAIELKGCLAGKGGETFTLVPSGNDRNCMAVVRGRIMVYPTKLYKQWRREAKETILTRYSPGQFEEPVVVYAWIYGGRGFMETRDWDNVQKCVGDAMAEAGVLPVPAGPPLKSGEERRGDDDVRSVKGWRTFYFTREEHMALTGQAAARKADSLTARLFIQLVEARKVDPFMV